MHKKCICPFCQEDMGAGDATIVIQQDDVQRMDKITMESVEVHKKCLIQWALNEHRYGL